MEINRPSIDLSAMTLSFWIVFVAADLAFVLTLLLTISHLFGLGLVVEPVRAIFGISVYYIEFVLALTLDLLAIYVLVGRLELYLMHRIAIGVAMLGIVVTGVRSALEMPSLMHSGFSPYGLIVPSSVYLLVLFMLALVTSSIALAERPSY